MVNESVLSQLSSYPTLPYQQHFHLPTSISISQLWQLQNCYKFHTFPHASSLDWVPARARLLPLQHYLVFPLSLSSLSDLLEITLTAIHFSWAFVFYYYLPLLYAIIICSMPCKIVGVIVMRGTRQGPFFPYPPPLKWGRVW